MKSKFNSLAWMFWGGLVCGSLCWIVFVGCMSFMYEYVTEGWLRSSFGWLFIISVLGYFFWTFLFSVLSIRAAIDYQGPKWIKYGTWLIVGVYTVAVMGAWAFLTHVTTMTGFK